MNLAKNKAVVATMALVALAGLSAACRGSGAASLSSDVSRVQVVTTTALLADFVRNVGGDRVEVRSIISPGADVHSFQSTPGDSVFTSQAALIVSNGMGLDGFLAPILNGARRAGSVHVVAAEGLDAAPVELVALTVGGHGDEDEADDDHGPSQGDPHLWQNPLHVIGYVERIRDGLMMADPAGEDAYRSNAATYIARLRDLDRGIEETLGAVPAPRRYLVTFHGAFGHFAQRYGWRVAALVPGDGRDVTPSAVVDVLARVKEQGIPAVFVEPQFNPGVLEQAARDAGIRVGTIYSDALDAQAPSYMDMMMYNARSLRELLENPN
jgi:ABC-type Zn uptake system ZnuABC Zn-binding protein ZnuA